jgi:hypothetical protein
MTDYRKIRDAMKDERRNAYISEGEPRAAMGSFGSWFNERPVVPRYDYEPERFYFWLGRDAEIVR